jgi:hypothetical protein
VEGIIRCRSIWETHDVPPLPIPWISGFEIRPFSNIAEHGHHQ